MRCLSQILIILGILVAGTTLIGVSYSFTASTDNTDNTSQSEYVVLNQDSYSFGSAELTFTTVTIKDPEGPGGPLVQFTVANSVDLSGFKSGYKGVRIGSPSSLQATVSSSNVPVTLEDVTVTTTGGSFADISGLDWYYVIKVTCLGETDQYVYCDGSTDHWKGTIDLRMQNDSDTSKKYTTELYLAIPLSNDEWDSIPTNVIDNGTIQFAYEKLEA